MEKLPSIKVWDIDYSFIIKNYLDERLWEKTYMLFAYKTFVITLNLYRIDCAEKEITFRIKVKDNSIENAYYDLWNELNRDKYRIGDVYYNLKINDIRFLKKKIQTTVEDIIYKLEREYIRGQEECQNIINAQLEEERKLTKIAEDFLDDNNVFNEDIREAYINTFVENNKKTNQLATTYLNSKQYSAFTDFYLVFAQSTKDKSYISRIESTIESYIGEIEEVKAKVDEYLQYMETEEWQDEQISNLEEI